MKFRNQKIAMGTLADAEYAHNVVTQASVRDLRMAIDQVSVWMAVNPPRVA